MIIFNHLCMYIYTHIRIEIYRSSHRVHGEQVNWGLWFHVWVRADQRQSFLTSSLYRRHLRRALRVRCLHVGRQRLAAAGALWATIHCTLNMHGQTALKKKPKKKKPTKENRRPVNCIVPTRLRLTRFQKTLNINRQAPQKQDKVNWRPSGTTWWWLRG